MRVNKQVAGEYLSMVYLTATEIQAHVRDFNFAHIVTFFNKLSDHELSALPSVNVTSSRAINVHVHVTENCPANPEGLQRWLLRSENATKKGTRVEVGYSTTFPTTCHRDTMFPTTLLQPNRLRDYMKMTLEAKLAKLGKVEKGRLYEELRKVVEAL